MLDRIQSLSPGESTLLHAEMQGRQRIEIREFENLRWMQIDGASLQSIMQLDNPAQPLMQTHMALLLALVFHRHPEALLNLGLGGGALERFFRDRIPDLALSTVESSQAVIRLARRFFELPADYPVVHQPAEVYLARVETAFDIILCDIFEGDRHPACLMDADFHARVFRALADEGVFALNLSPETEQELLNILLPMRRSFDWVLLLEISNHGNIVVLAPKREPPGRAEVLARAESLSGQLGIDLAGIAKELQRLPRSLLMD